jgi:hypothetical protein
MRGKWLDFLRGGDEGWGLMMTLQWGRERRLFIGNSFGRTAPARTIYEIALSIGLVLGNTRTPGERILHALMSPLSWVAMWPVYDAAMA